MKKKDYIGRLVEIKSVNTKTGVLYTETYRIKKIKDKNIISEDGMVICTIDNVNTTQTNLEYEITISLI